MRAARLRALALPGYLIVAMMMVLPFVDVWVISLPAEWTSALWRFGLHGTFTRLIETPAMALLFLVIMAASLGHRLVVRVVAVSSFIGAVLMLGAAAMFSFDALETRPLLVPETLQAFDRTIAVAMLKTLMAAFILGAFGLASWPFGKRRPARAS